MDQWGSPEEAVLRDMETVWRWRAERDGAGAEPVPFAISGGEAIPRPCREAAVVTLNAWRPAPEPGAEPDAPRAGASRTGAPQSRRGPRRHPGLIPAPNVFVFHGRTHWVTRAPHEQDGLRWPDVVAEAIGREPTADEMRGLLSTAGVGPGQEVVIEVDGDRRVTCRAPAPDPGPESPLIARVLARIGHPNPSADTLVGWPLVAEAIGTPGHGGRALLAALQDRGDHELRAFIADSLQAGR